MYWMAEHNINNENIQQCSQVELYDWSHKSQFLVELHSLIGQSIHHCKYQLGEGGILHLSNPSFLHSLVDTFMFLIALRYLVMPFGENIRWKLNVHIKLRFFVSASLHTINCYVKMSSILLSCYCIGQLFPSPSSPVNGCRSGSTHTSWDPLMVVHLC